MELVGYFHLKAGKPCLVICLPKGSFSSYSSYVFSDSSPFKALCFCWLVCLFVNNSFQNGSGDGSSSGSFWSVLFGGLGDGKCGTEETVYNIGYL